MYIHLMLLHFKLIFSSKLNINLKKSMPNKTYLTIIAGHLYYL